METRPSMRRKSSALLATLSRSTSQASTGASSHSLQVPDDDVAPPLPTLSGLESVRNVVEKRLRTWRYIKEVHEGGIFYLTTVRLSRDDLDGALARGQLGGVPPRTTRLAVLGMSLSNLLDIANPTDFLRGLVSLMSDFESFDGETRPKSSKGLLRPMKPRKSGAGLDAEESFLVAPNIPFELDYFQCLFTLCDILLQLYSKILGLLGAPAERPSPDKLATGGVPYAAQSPLQPPPPSLGLSEGRPPLIPPTMVEVVHKIDNKLKKVAVPIMKELDTLHRDAIREELATLQGLMGGGGEWDLDEVL